MLIISLTQPKNTTATKEKFVYINYNHCITLAILHKLNSIEIAKMYLTIYLKHILVQLVQNIGT